MAGVFCDGPDGRACFLRRLVMFFASVECVFCVGGVFCDGNPCFLRRLAQSPSRCFFLWVTHVFCDGNPCFLRRLAPFPLPVLFCMGNPCFLRRPEEVMFFATVPTSVW